MSDFEQLHAVAYSKTGKEIMLIKQGCHAFSLEQWLSDGYFLYGLWAVAMGSGYGLSAMRMKDENQDEEQSGSLFDLCSVGCFGSPPRTSKEPLCGQRLRIVLCILHTIHHAQMLCTCLVEIVVDSVCFVGVCGFAMHGMGKCGLAGAWWTFHVTEKMTWRIVKRRPSWWT